MNYPRPITKRSQSSMVPKVASGEV